MMPVWTEDDVRAAATVLTHLHRRRTAYVPCPTWDGSPRDAIYSADELKDAVSVSTSGTVTIPPVVHYLARFRFFGGIPRVVFSRRDNVDLYGDATLVSSIGISKAFQSIRQNGAFPTSANHALSERAHRLVCYQVDEDHSPHTLTLQWLSSGIANGAAQQMVQDEYLSLVDLVKAALMSYSLRPLAGVPWEKIAKHRITKGGTFRVRSLSSQHEYIPPFKRPARSWSHRPRTC
jgi:hypothetical protein